MGGSHAAQSYVGTVGTAIWSSQVGDLSAALLAGGTLHGSARLVADQPTRRGSRVFAGTDRGVYRWHGTTQKWEHIESPLDAFSTYTIAQSPHDPNFMLAGTHPARLYRSRDGGRTWDKLAIELPAQCDLIGGKKSRAFCSTPSMPDWSGSASRSAGSSLAGRREHLAENLARARLRRYPRPRGDPGKRQAQAVCGHQSRRKREPGRWRPLDPEGNRDASPLLPRNRSQGRHGQDPVSHQRGWPARLDRSASAQRRLRRDVERRRLARSPQ